MDLTLNAYYEKLLNYQICSEETLQTVISINGFTFETLNDILYVRTGYRNWVQFMEEVEV